MKLLKTEEKPEVVENDELIEKYSEILKDVNKSKN